VELGEVEWSCVKCREVYLGEVELGECSEVELC
jgi:hypothetical protein